MLLNGKWKLYFYDASKVSISSPDDKKLKEQSNVDCTVPGNIELDLSSGGILPKDLFKGMNIKQAEIYETYDWW